MLNLASPIAQLSVKEVAMKRMLMLFALVLLASLSIIFLVFSFHNKRDDAQKGHVRQAFLRHVRTVYFAKNPLLKGPPKPQNLMLYLIDERKVSEFSQASNIESIYLLAEDGSAFEVELQGIGAPRDLGYMPAGKEYSSRLGGALFERTIRVGVLYPNQDSTVSVTGIRFYFNDGVVEEFPIGRLVFKAVPDELVLIGGLTNLQFGRWAGTLAYNGETYQLGDAPLGMQFTNLAVRIPFATNELSRASQLGDGERLLGIDIGIDGIYVDWRHPLYSDQMKHRPPVVMAVKEELKARSEEDPELETGADSYFNVLVYVTNKNHYSREELRDKNPLLFLPDEYNSFKRGNIDTRFTGAIDDKQLAPDMDGVKALEAWYPVYYSPESDFTNTVVYFHPAIRVESCGVEKYRFVSFSPEVVQPSRYADLAALMEEQDGQGGE